MRREDTATPSFDLNAVDIAVVAVYLAIVLACGLWLGRSGETTAGYFLAGRTLPWYLIGLSLYASNMSGASFVGLIGAAYEHGIAVFHYEWTAAAALIVLALFMLPVFLRARLSTVTEYLERRYDRRARISYSIFTILAVMLIDTAGALYAGGLVLTMVFPGLALWQACAGVALVTGAYTIVGGLRAVVVTDALQAVLLIGGGLLVFVFGMQQVGGFEGLAAKLGADAFVLMRPADDDFLPWPGILGVVILGFYYWTLNHYFVQRALAARNQAEGAKGALFAGLLKLPNLLIMIFPGMIALALYPGLAPDLAFPTLAFDLLPAGLRGLVVVALLAAIMSSLDSALNAVAALATFDFVQPARPHWSDRRLLWTGRGLSALAMIVAAAYAPLIQNWGSLFRYFQATLAYLVPAIVAVYFLGLFWRRANAKGAMAALAGGTALGLVLYVAKEITGLWAALGLPALHFTYMALILCAVAAVIAVVVSLATPPPAAARELVVRWRDARGTRAGGTLSRPALQAAALALLTFMILLALA